MTTKKEISMRELITLRECMKALPFFNLSLHIRSNERLLFWEKLKLFFIGCLQNRMDKNDLKKQMEDFFKRYYKKSFFDSHIQYDAMMDKDKRKLFRMVNYIYSQGYIVVAGRTVFHVKMQKSYKGVELNGITDYVDMIVQNPEGRYLAILIEVGESQYSYSAKKESCRVENSIELASMYLGLCNTYGHDLEVAIFYLKNKEDRNDTLVDIYNHRKGRNIIQWSFLSEEHAWAKLLYDMKMVIPCECQACWYHEVCRTPRYYSCSYSAEPGKRDKRKQMKIGQLTSQQEEVVKHKTGQMYVIAVPGAGKTYSLVRRMVHLIQEGHVAPSKILFLTYTQKAAGEIKERVQRLLGEGGSHPSIFTFNALGYSILRGHPESLSKGARLASKVDRYRLIEETLYHVPRIKGVSYDGITGEHGLLDKLNHAFCFIENFSREHYCKAHEDKEDVKGILAAYDFYIAVYRARGYISFDDQVHLVNDLFTSRPDVLKQYQRQYQYIMVDEFQDVSDSQAQMVYSIGAHGNIVVVGDDDQSIFGFRGGSSRYMLEFAHRWPGAKRITMEDNFRSVDTVLHAADLVISKNRERFTKKIRAHSYSQEKPIYVSGMAAQDIWGLVHPLITDGIEPGDIAIIARKNKELTEIGESLCTHIEILPSRQYLIRDAVFMAIYDILKLYHHGMEDCSLYRYLKMMQADGEIPKQKVEGGSLYSYLCQQGLLLPIEWHDVGCLPAYKKRSMENRLLNAGYQLIRLFKDIQYTYDMDELLHIMFRRIFHEEQHLVIDALSELAVQRRMETSGELLEYMECMLRYHDETEIEYPRRKDAINLLTVHKAKGKEYPIVIAFNVESYADTIEDRRLLYVAMTRAKEKLYLTQGPYSKAELVPDIINHVETHYSQIG